MNINTVRPLNNNAARRILIHGWERCLICGDNCFTFTDWHMEVRCCQCGVAYQRKLQALSDDYLAELGLKDTDVVRPYPCRVMELSLFKLYWRIHKRPIPDGTYVGDHPDSQENFDSYHRWLAVNADGLKRYWLDYFRWDVLLEHYG